MLNLAKLNPAAHPALQSKPQLRKISYERENFSLAYQPFQEPEQQHKPPQQKLLLARVTYELVQEVGRSKLKRHRNLLHFPLSHHQVLMLMIPLRVLKVFLHYARLLVAPSCSRADD